ncbi:MAG TPA: glycosyltransferase [Geobacteraceae bacterium]|nr:glycosyltransferase [Geobacteraceae bacterium]
MKKLFKADLHVHSSHSNKPTYWALRKFNCPESYTSPRFVYDTARKQGMDYVTISDHNTISGALEIAHLPGAFISCELTSYFPEDNCKMHVVVLHINESIFRDLMELRKNVYELVAYLQGKGIAHFIAHPLYAQNKLLTADHIEKMVLLFNVFEAKNGCRAHRYNSCIEAILAGLTPGKMDILAERHGIAPYGPSPWHKGMVGGSDDHSGLFIARAFTTVSGGKSLAEFIGCVINRESTAQGEDGDPLTLAHSIYGIGYSFYRERFKSRLNGSPTFIKALTDRFFDVGADRLSLLDRIRFLVKKNLPEMSGGYEGWSFEEILDREAKRLLSDTGFLASIDSAGRNQKIFAVTSYLANRMIYIYTERLTRVSFNEGLFGLFNSVSTISLVHLLVSPYYLAFHHQHRSKDLLTELAERFSMPGRDGGAEKIALFTDTLDEINGVAITIRRLIKTAQNKGVELTVITSTPEKTAYRDGVMNFQSIGDCALPEYPELKLHFPPILDVIDYIEREGFTRIHISTPGTVGLLAMLVAKLMDLPVAGTYHTDIPQYVRDLTNDDFLEHAAWSYMIWFYSQMEEVMVPSASTRAQLIEHGLAAARTRPLPRWVDTELFSPAKKVHGLWRKGELYGRTILLYVGRVSKEKNLELLAQSFSEVVDAGHSCGLVVIGDGPYREEMEKKLVGYPAVFAGFLGGEELSRGYASADLFVFPSATDTFGNVVLEAQASGLPVIVSDEGGPKELMKDGETGIVVRAGNKESLVAAIISFINDRQKIAEMGENARTFTLERGANAGEAYSTILRQPVAVNY